jgi:hypothetical protein
MEIKIIKKGSSDYYSEVLAVMSDCKKIAENPRKKIRKLNTQAIILTAIALVFLVIFSILYINDKSNTLHLIVVVIFAIALIAGIIYNILINRRISNFKNDNVEKTLVIEDDYVELIVGSNKTRLEMSEIKYIIINKYSICFFPSKINSTIIAVSVDYKDSILKAIGNSDLIVDNSSLYQ